MMKGLRFAALLSAAATSAFAVDGPPLKVSHAWIVVEPGARERSVLERAGFRIAPTINRHEHRCLPLSGENFPLLRKSVQDDLPFLHQSQVPEKDPFRINGCLDPITRDGTKVYGFHEVQALRSCLLYNGLP